MGLEERANSSERQWRKGIPLSEAVASLLDESFTHGPESITNARREFRIESPVTPDSLQELSLLPFEVLLSEHAAGVTLVTGSEAAIWDNKDNFTGDRTRKEARYTLHNHPDTIAASPSDGDIQVSRTSNSDIDFIVAREGITVHKGSYDRLVSQRAPYFDMAILRGGDHAVRKDIQMGYAKAWIPWGDPRVTDICNYINKQVEWEELEERIKVPQQ